MTISPTRAIWISISIATGWILLVKLSGLTQPWLQPLPGLAIGWTFYRAGRDAGHEHLALGTGVLSAVIVSGALIPYYLNSARSSINSTVLVSDEQMVLALAGDIAERKVADGEQLDWPNGRDQLSAQHREDFPPQVLTIATAQWAGAKEAERDQMRQRRQHLIESHHATETVAYKGTLLLRLFWTVLAISGAFVLASRSVIF